MRSSPSLSPSPRLPLSPSLPLLAYLLLLSLLLLNCNASRKKVIGVVPKATSHLFWVSVQAGA